MQQQGVAPQAIQMADARTSNGNSRNSGRGRDYYQLEDDDYAKKVTFRHQFFALFFKDFQLQFKSYKTNICQLLVPIIFICFTGLIQVIVNALIPSNLLAPGSDSRPLPIDVGRAVACFNSTRPEYCYNEAANFLLDFDIDGFINSTEEIPQNNFTQEIKLLDVFVGMLQESNVPLQNVLFGLPFYYMGKADSVDLNLGNLSDTGDREGFQGLLVPPKWAFKLSLNFTINPDYENISFVDDEDVQYLGNDMTVPFMRPLPNNSVEDFKRLLVDIVREYNRLENGSLRTSEQYNRVYAVNPLNQEQFEAVLDRVQARDLTLIRPMGGIYINELETSESAPTLNYSMIANDLVMTRVYYYENRSNIIKISHSDIEIQRRNNIINMMHNAFLKHVSGEPPDSEEVPIVTYIMPLFTEESKLNIDIVNILGGVLFPFATSFLLPVYMASLVKDKFEKHLIMMEQNGLDRFTYWFVTYIFNFTLYVVVAVVIVVVALAWQMRLFIQTDPLILFLTLLLWGHAQVVLGFFLSNLFDRTRTATIVGYLLVIASVVVAELLEVTEVFPADETPIFVYMMYPPFAFYRLLFYLLYSCQSFRCYQIESLIQINLVTSAMLYMIVSTFLLIFVSIYLSYVLPSEYGVRKNPFFPIIDPIKFIMKKSGLFKQNCATRQLRQTASETSLLMDDQENEEVDEDVQMEEDQLNEGYPDDYPVVIHMLRKEYPGSWGQPKHVAVHSLSLAIPRNECFGLLGPNGAGKTTLISVLTGLYEPTKGTARIAGYDLLTDMAAIHHHLGVCPQFDIQYPELTAEEHLLFYARLKGVKLGRARKVVNNALKQVNLYDARKRQSRNLSGGMRRRLSVAMACIGNPDILILDEPTTGLDPASRRQVWEVIEKVKEGRSVILTTHAMEEADHLCTRIGIMNYGKLRCVGSQLRLKAKFGMGYQLQFHCSPGRVQEVERYIAARLTAAIHVETYADSCTYRLEKEDLIVSELFQLLDSVRDQIGIVDWGIKMTTMEDVFLNIVQKNSDTRSQDEVSHCPAWIPCPCCPRKQ